MIQSLMIEKILPYAVTPAYATDGSAGLDLYATSVTADGPTTILEIGDTIEVSPNQTVVVGTGLKIQIPVGNFGMIVPRSGMALKGLGVANSPGIIDSDYRGEIKILLHNHSNNPLFFTYLSKIAQIVILPFTKYVLQLQDVDGTIRGEDGFGSTGS